jgi:hypothetical protein
MGRQMCDMLVCFPSSIVFRAIVVAFSPAALVSPTVAAELASIPDLSGQWGRDNVAFEPPLSGPGPVMQTVHNADGTIDVLHAWVGDATNPILKPRAAEAVRKFGESSLQGKVVPDLHNRCWPEPPPFVLGAHFGVLIIQERNEVTLIYLLQNTVRHVRLNAFHPANLKPSWQGDSIGRYEGDTLVIDTVGAKTAPISTVDMMGTPHSEALHVIERYRLIDGKAAAEAERRHGIITRMPGALYGRGPIDQDVSQKGLQVEFRVEDANYFTSPWTGLVTYRRSVGDWPESICADNPDFEGSDAAPRPTANRPDF